MDNNYLVPIGHRLREICHSRGMTQEILADSLGVSPKFISHTVCGNSRFSIENLIEFCNIFNCSLAHFRNKTCTAIINFGCVVVIKTVNNMTVTV